MAWRAANSLLVLHAQLKRGSRAAPPATDADAWGLIGDAAHDPTSDHTPHDFPGWGDDIVTAADFPNRPDLGLDAHAVLDDIRRARDPRAKYGISNGQIFSNHTVTEGGHTYPAWTWRPYNPSNGDRHFTHGHLSVVGDARADGEQPWPTIGGDVNLTDAVADTGTPATKGAPRNVGNIFHDQQQKRSMEIGELPLSTYPADAPYRKLLEAPDAIAARLAAIEAKLAEPAATVKLDADAEERISQRMAAIVVEQLGALRFEPTQQ